MSSPSLVQLKQAITIAERIEKLQAELAVLIGTGSSVQGWETGNGKTASSSTKKRGGKRTMSPETIAKMRASQQARWAKKDVTILDVLSPLDAPSKSKRGGKRKMSAAGRARIVAAQKARWAAKKGTEAVTAVETAVENAVKSTTKLAKKTKRNLSPEGRAKIVAALKKRWAAKKKSSK